MKKSIGIGLSLISTLSFNYSVNAGFMVMVKGNLIYPSDYLPAMVVCAVNINSKKRYCIKTKEEQSTFSMKIPSGKYLFSAETEDFPDKKAWMTNFNIECGYPCSNNPVYVTIVEIYSGVTTGICPCDWYTDENKLIFP